MTSDDFLSWLEAHNWSDLTAARELGVSREHVWRIRSGKITKVPSGMASRMAMVDRIEHLEREVDRLQARLTKAHGRPKAAA